VTSAVVAVVDLRRVGRADSRFLEHWTLLSAQ
jgi:hypothetical protein